MTAFWPYLLIAAMVLLTYGATLSGGFVWDDSLFTANRVYWQFDLRTIFLSLANGLEYLPVRDVTYLADIALWGDRPFGFHLTNLLVFLVIVMLVYRFSLRLCSWLRGTDGEAGKDRFVALGAALLFALHPLRSEVVAWVTQRNTLLATLFCLISLLLFCRHQDGERGRGGLAASLGAFVLAIFSKAIVVILPLLLLLLSACRGGEKRFAWRPVIPFFLVAAAAAVLHIAIARKTTVISAAYGGSIGERISVATQIPLHYLAKTLFPIDLSAFYPDGFSRSLTSPAVVLNGAVLLLVTVVIWRLRRRLPELAFGYGWYLVALLPVSNLFATSPVVADRYTFLPAIGLSFALAALAGRLAEGNLRRGCAAAGALLLVILAVMTHGRNRVWQSNITLWSDTALRSPGVAGVWFNLGRAWHRTTRLGMALDAYLRAVRLDPGDVKSLDNAAALFPSTAGPLPYRKELVADLARQMPPSPAGISLIGHSQTPWEHPESAEALFLGLLETDPASTELQLALANLYLKVGAPERAAAIYAGIRGSGAGKGEAEFGLARIAAASGDRTAAAQLLAIARQKGGVPESLLRMVDK